METCGKSIRHLDLRGVHNQGMGFGKGEGEMVGNALDARKG
jgi:hypothetical protein